MFARTSNGQTDQRANGQTPTIVKPQSGFTMVEMVAVVLILSLLIGISSTAISGARRTAMRTHSRDIVRQLANSWTSYVTDQGSFPDENKFKGSVGDLIPASAYNIGALLNTQYMADGKTPYSGSLVYLRGQVKNPVVGGEVITASAVGVSTAGYSLNDRGKYGSKFIVAW